MFYVKSPREITTSKSGWLHQRSRTENWIFWIQKKS